MDHCTLFPRSFVLAFALLFAAAPAPASEILIEAEDYVTYGDMHGRQIEVVNCDGALNGVAVDGVDVAGEWLLYQFDLPERTCMVDLIYSSRVLDWVASFRVEFLDAEGLTVLSSDTLTTAPGRGVT